MADREPIDPAVLNVEFTCVATADELCGVDYWAYYMFTGHYPKLAKASAAKTKKKLKQLTIAHAAATLHGGEHRTVKLKLTEVGRKLIRLRRKLKIIVKTRVKIGSRTATERAATTLKAPKARHKH